MFGSAALDTLARDLRFSLRAMTRNAGFTCVAVLTIALGVGATCAMFSVVQGVILASLPFPRADRLLFLWQKRPGVPRLEASFPNFEDWARTSSSFSSMSAIEFHNFDLNSPGKAEHLTGIRVSSAFLATLGVKPSIGRDFGAADDAINAPPAGLISDRLWKQRYGADPHVVGSPVVLDGKSFTVVGVLPAGFHFLADADVMIPLRPSLPAILRDRSVDGVAVLARLKPGLTTSRAEAEMNAVQRDLDRRYPDANRGVGIALTSLKQEIVGDVKGTVWLLFGAVTFVLLIACANVAR